MNNNIMLVRINHLYLFLIIATICNFSCSTDMDTDSINLRKNDKVSLETLFGSIKVIQLETKPESLFGRIIQLELFHGKYYVFCQQKQEILCFDQEGFFLHKISKQGRAPEEYFFITSFTIDPYNQRLILMSPSVQHLDFFDLEGNFIEKQRIGLEFPVAFNRVFPINDTIILITSGSHYQFTYYCTKNKYIISQENEIINTHVIGPLWQLHTTYRFDGNVYGLDYLQRTVKNYSTPKPTNHFSFCFGNENNTNRQIKEITKYANDSEWINKNYQLHDILGSLNYLNSHIMAIQENSRYIFALVATNEAFKHILIDKKRNITKVFDSFKEDVCFNRFHKIHENKHLVAFETRYFDLSRADEYFGNYKSHFVAPFYSTNILSPECQNIIQSHNPETDNPFLVVYTFKD